MNRARASVLEAFRQPLVLREYPLPASLEPASELPPDASSVPVVVDGSVVVVEVVELDDAVVVESVEPPPLKGAVAS